MKKEVDPNLTPRKFSYQSFVDAPMPMCTILKKVNVSHLLKIKGKGYKFNMLMCYVAVRAAENIEEFKWLPVGKKLYEYDTLGVNLIVANKKGGINFCNVPFSSDLETFNQFYLQYTHQVYETCENNYIEDVMAIGTSSLVKHEIDGAINMYVGNFNNPFLAWGKYTTEAGEYFLNLSFQFHHVQMDGEQACRYLENFQQAIYGLNV